MGIDYGSKRVGVATTDESGTYALPRVVLSNDDTLLTQILALADEYKAEKIVIGESKKLDGSANLILKDIKTFAEKLKEKGRIVEMHPEMFTSLEAERLQGKNDMLDASAASLILKSYIDSHAPRMITIDEFKKGEISIGKILSVMPVEGSEKLLKLSVDFGEERPRTVLSGIRKYFPNEQELVGVKCAFATNLEPRPLMGEVSEAMILAVSNDTTFSLLKVSEDVPTGLKVK